MAWTSPRTWVAGEFPTAATLNTHVRDNLKEVWYDASYVEATSPVSITATTEATANTIVTAGALTFDGVADCMIEFFCPRAIPAAASSIIFCLYDGTSIGQIGRVVSVSGSPEWPVYLRRRFVPSAASHTFSIRAFVGAGTATVTAGAGGLGAFMPAYIWVTRRDA